MSCLSELSRPLLLAAHQSLYQCTDIVDIFDHQLSSMSSDPVVTNKTMLMMTVTKVICTDTMTKTHPISISSINGDYSVTRRYFFRDDEWSQTWWEGWWILITSDQQCNISLTDIFRY